MIGTEVWETSEPRDKENLLENVVFKLKLKSKARTKLWSAYKPNLNIQTKLKGNGKTWKDYKQENIMLIFCKDHSVYSVVNGLEEYPSGGALGVGRLSILQLCRQWVLVA